MNSNSRCENGLVCPWIKPPVALYLEDNTPVRTIEATKFKDDVTSEYIRGYFECRAGPISEIVLANKRENNKEERVAYVTFIRPEDAAKLIFSPSQELTYKFAVKAAENNYQPKIDPNAFKFEDINDDCLLHIASLLNLADIVNLSKSCKRLNSFSQLIFQKETYFSFGSPAGTAYPFINEANLEAALQEMGSYFKWIEWHNMNVTHFDFLAQYCPNVTKLILRNPLRTLHIPIFKKNVKFFSKMDSLEISGSRFSDGAFKYIVSSTELTSLHLDSCTTTVGKFLSKWKRSKLRILQIKNCRKISSEVVFQFIQTNGLKLVLFSFDAVSSFQSFLRLPADLLSNVQWLYLDSSNFHNEPQELENIENCRQLKHLTLTNTVYQYQNYNLVLTQLSFVPLLTSLVVYGLDVNANTAECLHQLTNLRKLNLFQFKNGIGQQFYISLCSNLQHIVELNLLVEFSNQTVIPSVFCEAISSLSNLRKFSYNYLSLDLLHLMLKERTRLKRSPIEIEISDHLLHDKQVVEFNAINKGVIKLTKIRSYYR